MLRNVPSPFHLKCDADRRICGRPTPAAEVRIPTAVGIILENYTIPSSHALARCRMGISRAAIRRPRACSAHRSYSATASS